VKGAGTVFATIGTGGTPLRDVNLSDPESAYFVTSSGANQNGTYGFGDFDVTPDSLLMRFVRGAGASFTDAFTITRDANPPANQKPTAAFSSTSDGLTASLDASTSSDPEGPIATYAWDFGDGSVGSGVKPAHPYDKAGTYPVKLTVTDAAGETDVVSHDVTVTDPPTGTVLASDEFERTAASSWGRADVGGTWTLRGVTSRFSVGGGAGRLLIPSGATLFSDLTSVSSQNSRTTAEFSVDKLTAGTYVVVVGRQVGSDYYAARLVAQNGVGRLYLMGGGGAAIGTNTSTFAFTAGDHYRVLLEVKGKSPTTVRAKIWKTTDPEPATWQRTTTDSFAALQASGRVGVFGYLSSSATNGPVTVSFHQFAATDAN
jgi:PKD repeat protein